MATNEEHRQVELAGEVSEGARALAHSTGRVPAPFASYQLLGELVVTVDDLEQVCRQLAAWHDRVVDGVHYTGEDTRGDGATGTVTAAAELRRAAAALDDAASALRAAHAANGVVRWFDEVPADQQT
ncbi:hypothetical protein J7E29_16720 [Streptomyces sp. ISL-90]|nr:hypothetical protein [Streptomyces sp. ISL-90]